MTQNFDEMDKLREQYQLLGQTLDKQQIINDKLIKKSMMTHVSGLDHALQIDLKQVMLSFVMPLLAICVLIPLTISLERIFGGGPELADGEMWAIIRQILGSMTTAESVLLWLFISVFGLIGLMNAFIYRWEKGVLSKLEEMIEGGEAPVEIARYAHDVYDKTHGKLMLTSRMLVLVLLDIVLFAFVLVIGHAGVWEMVFVTLCCLVGLVLEPIRNRDGRRSMLDNRLISRKKNKGLDYHLREIIRAYEQLA